MQRHAATAPQLPPGLGAGADDIDPRACRPRLAARRLLIEPTSRVLEVIAVSPSPRSLPCSALGDVGRRLLAAAAVVAAVAGCRSSPTTVHPPGPDPGGRCAADGSLVGNNLPMNNLPMNNLPMNGLSYASLATNLPLIEALATSALTPDFFADAGRAALLDQPYAVELMKYAAACALDPCESVDAPVGLPAAVRDRLVEKRLHTGRAADADQRIFAGELGLCGSRYAATTRRNGVLGFRWSSMAPLGVDVAGRLVAAPDSPGGACLQRVSACMLARTNAMRAKVMISLRGDGTELADRVPVSTMFRENDGTPIVSFDPPATCAAGARTDLRVNCGWQPHYVGQCAVASSAHGAANHVRLRARVGGRPVDVRVCRGIYGCDLPRERGGTPITAIATPIDLATLDPLSPAGDVPNPPFYGGTWLDDSADGVVDVACPANGPIVDGRALGYYSVMVRARDGRPIDPAQAAVELVGATGPLDVYPAAEAQVFRYREGAFFGDLFTFQPRDVGPIGPSMLDQDQHACHSNVWSEDGAMLAYRLCAGHVTALPAGCFASPPGRCDGLTLAGAPTPLGKGQCDGDGASAPTARTCRSPGDGRTWPYPYTTYLNHPCDLFATREACVAAVVAPLRELVRNQVSSRP